MFNEFPPVLPERGKPIDGVGTGGYISLGELSESSLVPQGRGPWSSAETSPHAHEAGSWRVLFPLERMRQ